MKRRPGEREDYQRIDFEREMQRLLQRRAIAIVSYGPPSANFLAIVRAPADEQTPVEERPQ
jgi:hypothetical protein